MIKTVYIVGAKHIMHKINTPNEVYITFESLMYHILTCFK